MIQAPGGPPGAFYYYIMRTVGNENTSFLPLPKDIYMAGIKDFLESLEANKP